MKLGVSSIISTHNKDNQVTFSNGQENNVEKERSIDWNMANGNGKDIYTSSNRDSIEIILEQLRNAQDDPQVIQYLEALVTFLTNQKVR